MSTPSGRPRAASTFTPAAVVRFGLLGGIWGGSFLFIKIVVDQVSPLWLVAGRVVMAAVFLGVVVAVRRRPWPRGTRVWLHLLVLASLGNVVPWALVAAAEQSIPSGLAAVINSLTPAFTMAIAAGVGIERLGLARVLGLGLALLDTVIVVSGELGVPGRMAAVVGCVVATVFYAGTGVYTKRFVSGAAAPLELAAGQLVLASLVSVPVSLVFAPTPPWGALTAGTWVAWLALGLFGTGVAFVLFYDLIDRVGATNAAMVTYVIPPIGLVAGWLILSETVGWHVVVGALAIIGGIWLGQRERRAKVAADAEAADTEPQPVGV